MPGYKHMTLDLVDSDMTMLRADRDRGAAPVNNMYNAGLAVVSANKTPKEIFPWYEGENNEPEYLIKLLIDNPIAMGLLLAKVSTRTPAPR